MLSKLDRNTVFAAVEAAGLSPSDFQWDHRADDDEAEARLEHRPSGAYFIFRGSPGAYSSSSRAGDHPVRDRMELSWYRLMQQVELWLADVKRDNETPDLWAQLHSGADVLTAAAMDAIEDKPFTADEQAEIARRLEELKHYISRTHELSEVQTLALGERLEYLSKAATRLGRKDWLLLAGGVILSYALESALPPAASSDVLRALLSSIGDMLGRGLSGG